MWEERLWMMAETKDGAQTACGAGLRRKEARVVRERKKLDGVIMWKIM
jgi:hypothetical protein